MMKYFFAVFTMLLIVGCGNSQQQDGIEKVTPEAFSKKLEMAEKPQLIDVRTLAEFSEGHLQNALNLDINEDDFEKQLQTLDKAAPVYVYCRSGGRSAKAVEQMKKMGFREIYELEGGILSWKGEVVTE
ncbi:MAG: rhodanese-like domain-containing protein [Flavobacteriia bacterium]|nr:rhodanese-like domain-containing protein [Flavobacteriia bacterium]OJX35033.1 MAG: hypothetical protein BGO87_09395 [Flavobacteriia bacterium 40-80]